MRSTVAHISKYSIIILVFIVFTNCSKATKNKEDFISYLNNEENDLTQKKMFNDVSFILNYEPIELKVLQDFNFKQVPAKKMEEKKKEYEGMIYFKFKLQSKDGVAKSPFKNVINSKEGLNKLKQYCLSYLINDFYIETNSKTKAPDLFYLEDDFSMLNYNQICLAFDSTNLNIANEGFTFVYNDQLLNNGLMKFKITKETLNSIPKLNYNL